MLALKDFYHLPQVDSLVQQMVSGRAGLVVVAGLDPRPGSGVPPLDGFLPSGRSTIFGILAREVLATYPGAQATLVAAERDAVRLPPALKARVRLPPTKNVPPPAEQLAAAVDRRSDIILIDGLDAETVPLALAAGEAGARVVAQFDCVFQRRLHCPLPVRSWRRPGSAGRPGLGGDRPTSANALPPLP